jgi:YidC/Oxa1 family membrane protein insertase
MEDQGKRVLLAVVLCMVIVGVWSWLFAPKPPPKEQAAPEQAQPAQPAQPQQPGAAPAAPATQPGASPPATATPAVPGPRGEEKTITLTTSRLEATFSSWGGALKSLRLRSTQYRMRTADGKEAPMDLVRTGDDSRWYPLLTTMEESTFAIPVEAEWVLEQRSELEVAARYTSDTLEVVKRYRLQPDSYIIELAVEVTNKSQTEAKQRLALHLFSYQDPNAPEGGMFTYAPPKWAAGCFVNGEPHFDHASTLVREKKERLGDVRWVAMAHKYFLFAAATKPVPDERLLCAHEGAPDRAGVMDARLVFIPWTLKAGDMAVKTVTIFAGPKILPELERTDEQLRLTASVDWGPAPTKWFAFIARPMLSLLRLFHGWVGNWGIAIIMLTIVVKLLTLYWTQKSMRSMKAMSKLKPKMDEIREKYANDKERQNVEMMRMYKEQGINPLGGCLPMLLQMPIWMALYSALGAAAELYQAPFFGWIRDLTSPDPYYILPVALTVFMFLQSKLSPAAVDSTQQKMMMYMMPLMFGFFSLVFPSGLTVYIFTNTILSMLHQVYMNRTDPANRAEPPAPKAPLQPAVKATPSGRRRR